MREEIKKDYKESLGFWNTALEVSDDELKGAFEGADPENDWKDMSGVEKLNNAAISLGSKKKVLDYGCGQAWAAIMAAKSGCPDVTAVDLIDSFRKCAQYYADFFGVSDRTHFMTVDETWIANEPSAKYDGFFCSNVIDVVPVEVAENIIKEAARITTDDASIIFGMNYYSEPVANPERNEEIKDGYLVYVNGVLRMATRTDEDWCKIFEKYFVVEKLDHFAWPGEATERRRLFFLKKK